MSKQTDEPVRKPSHDGIYPRCVWCNGEIYGPAVLDYSRGKFACGAVNGCGKYLPQEYIALQGSKDSDELASSSQEDSQNGE